MIKKFLITAAILLVPNLVFAQLGTTTRIPEGTCTAGASTIDTICANSADHVISISANNGATFNVPQTFYSTGSYTNATTGFTSVVGLAFPVSASRNYHAICNVYWQGSASTTGPKYQWTGPASPTSVLAAMWSNVTASTFTSSVVAAFSTPMANTGTITTATNFRDQLELNVVNGVTAGTAQLQMAANGAGTLTVQNGSNCIVQ